MASVIRAFGDGVRRVSRAPAVYLGVLLLTFLFTLPLGLALRGALREHLGSSQAAAGAAQGVNYAWWEEFSSQAEGLGTTFQPGIIGFAAVLENLSAMLDNRGQPGAVAAAAAVYIVLWVFLAGGILDRYARNRALGAAGFFSAAGVFFFRFLRLAVMAGLVYYLLFAYVHGWLFDLLFPRLTRDYTVERDAFAVRLVLYAVFGLLLVAANLVFDYAKVRAVVEDRRSMIGAIVAALRFARRHAAQVAGLCLLDGLLFVAVLALYAMVAPGAGRVGWSMWLALLVTQTYVLARLWVRLVFYASETALFQQALAHAGYTAAPLPAWPDSPAAEAIAPSDPAGEAGR